jgi:hypothetical protein
MLKHYKTGLKSPVPGSVALKFSDVYKASALPTPPKTPWGRAGLVKNYGMLGNDQYGDCVPAGQDHLVMLRNKVVGVDVPFTTDDALDSYSSMTGFSKLNPFSDQGTDIQEAAEFWQKTGMRDTVPNFHQIDAYVDLQIGNVEQVCLSAWLFVGSGIGVNLPSSAEDQFRAGQPFTVVQGDSNEGGHYIVIIDVASNGNLVCVTWGAEQELTPDWLAKYMIFGVGYLSKDIMNKTTNLSPTQLNYDTLDAYLKELTS